jgi:hypothetical protein
MHIGECRKYGEYLKYDPMLREFPRENVRYYGANATALESLIAAGLFSGSVNSVVGYCPA